MENEAGATKQAEKRPLNFKRALQQSMNYGSQSI
jgi:hypothetical protein